MAGHLAAARVAPAGRRGVFEGYASLFGVPDAAGDVVMPGAFAASLRRRGAHGIRMLFQHDPGQPVGVWLDLREDERGLLVRGRLTPQVQRADELVQLMAERAIDGLSIGFRTVVATRDRMTRRRQLIAVDLWEISLVTFPMLEGARVTALAGAPAVPLRKTRSRDGPQRPGAGAAGSSLAAAFRAGAHSVHPYPCQGAVR